MNRENQPHSPKQKYRNRVVGGALTGLLLLTGCAPTGFENTPVPQPTPSEPTPTPKILPKTLDLAPYDIILTPDLNRDMTKAIDFALASGAAQTLDRSDLYHCHLFIDRKTYDEKYSASKYKGRISNWIESIVLNYQALVCHTQESVDYTKKSNLDSTKRNVVIGRGGSPFIGEAKARQVMSLKNIDKVLNKDLAQGPTLYFYPKEGGEIKLETTQELNVVVENPDVYLTLTNGNMINDLPNR